MNLISNIVFGLVGNIFQFLNPYVNQMLPLDKGVLHVKNELQSKYAETNQYPVLDFIGLVNRQSGYTAEEHFVRTDDNYLLRIHRITSSPRYPYKNWPPQKKVIYIQHGIFLSSDSYVTYGPENSLAFILADQGYDVWLGNVRGNTYGMSHLNHDPKTPQFWDFSFHELGYYDLKASIDHVLNVTNQKDLTYYGYSMGGTMFLVLTSMRPEYNSKISLAYLLAPAAFWGYELRRVTKAFVDVYPLFKDALEYYRLHHLLPQSPVLAEAGNQFCGDDSPSGQKVCSEVLSKMIGIDENRINRSLIPDILTHFPAGSGRDVVLNYYQNHQIGRFQAYDYGNPMKNFEKYGSPSPPVYPLNRITTPVIIWYARNDEIMNHLDIRSLAGSLRSLVSLNAVQYLPFNHFDFLWSVDVSRLVYQFILGVY